MRTSLLSFVVLLTALVAAGCAGSATTPGSAARTVHVGFADDGRTVHVHPGDLVEVRLHSTYWTFASPRGDTLHPRKPIVHAAPIRKTVPGSGAGTVTAGFDARRRGRATIVAVRRLCGEVLRCVGGRGRFRIFVVVG